MELRHIKRSDVPRKDLTGARYDRLTVIAFNHRRVYNNSKNTVVYWDCLCSCGETITVSSVSLNNGATRSCGCLRREQAALNSKQSIRNNKGLSHTKEYALWSSAKERAKKYNRDFDIEVKDIFIPDSCPVFGIKLEHGIGRQHAGSPTLDRVDSSKGYTKDNIRVISQRANSMKQDASIEQLEKLVSYMKGEIK